MLDLSSPIENIHPIAKKITPKLNKLGIFNINDLLHYLPFRWEDWSQVKKISEVAPNTSATIRGQIELIQNKKSPWKKRLITEAIITDDESRIKAVWFHQPYLIQNLHPGDNLFLSGKIELKEDGLQIIHPNYEKISAYKDTPVHTARIVPIYPLTKNITSKQLRFFISKTIGLANKIPEWLPASIIQENHLANTSIAFRQIHFPNDLNALNIARDRLKFDELFFLQLRSALIRNELKKNTADKIKFHETPTKNFVNSLPFKLTSAQKISSWEIIKDLEKNTPMNRLLEGDVGSGKTMVACLAILNALLSGFQVAYMAPTEILSQQHFANISKYFQKLPFTIALLTRTEKKTNKTNTDKIIDLYQQISRHEVDLVIGTHALIQDKVIFDNLALVIVDEQHRFGVKQRKKLKQKNNKKIPHFLSMTATPIPRSLALTAYGDLDLSIINQMPPGRKKIITKIIAPEKRHEQYAFINEQIKLGRQVFILCPLIDLSDKLGVKAVKDVYRKLNEKIFPQHTIGMMHGKLKPQEKERVMRDFLKNKIHILVSTPVIEVGIDVPNATIMLIESAERFGLAQLHQLRGRVGRSQYQSYCFLFTESQAEETMQRMQALVESDDGFALAEKDMAFRGPGETFGIKQSGFDDHLKIAKLTDYLIIKKSKKVVDTILAQDPQLKKHPLLRQKVEEFEQNIHLE